MQVGTLAAIVLVLLGGERLVELAINRRHTRWLNAQGARWHAPDGFGLILASQIALFLLVAVEVSVAPWPRIGWWTLPLLALALVAQLVRYWVIRTLGPRWSIRVVTLPEAPRIQAGPYRWLRHPNYAAVALEAVAIPLALSAWVSALVLVPLALTALARRIRFEERALGGASA